MPGPDVDYVGDCQDLSQFALDFVFASSDLAEHIHVSARNQPEAWGPSDHCRVEVDVK